MAGPTPFGPELGEVDNSTHDKKGNPGFKIAKDWRCTTKPGKLYIHLFKYPAKSFELAKVSDKVKKAYMLADDRHSALKFTQSGDTVTVTVPPTAPNPLDSVLVLETAAR
jgi:alpha-L-fucosidase